MYGLHAPFYFLQAKATVLLAAGAIASLLGEFLAECQGQLRAVDPQEVIHIAATGWSARITVKARTGEIGTACNHCCLVDHQKLVVHQATAAGAVACCRPGVSTDASVVVLVGSLGLAVAHSMPGELFSSTTATRMPRSCAAIRAWATLGRLSS